MKVKELIEKLQEFDPEAEVHISTDNGWDTRDIHEAYATEIQFGWALRPLPPKTKVVVLFSGSEGL
jgi:hypothetical protein